MVVSTLLKKKSKIGREMAKVKTFAGKTGVNVHEADPVGEIGTQHIEGSKDAIDAGAAKFWAKRGIKDPQTQGLQYGRVKAAKSKKSD